MPAERGFRLHIPVPDGVKNFPPIRAWRERRKTESLQSDLAKFKAHTSERLIGEVVTEEHRFDDASSRNKQFLATYGENRYAVVITEIVTRGEDRYEIDILEGGLSQPTKLLRLIKTQEQQYGWRGEFKKIAAVYGIDGRNGLDTPEEQRAFLAEFSQTSLDLMHTSETADTH